MIYVSVVTDMGNEFQGAVTKMLNKHATVSKLYIVPGRTKSTVLVEASNRTLLGHLRIIFLAEKTNRWVDILLQVITDYNNSMHSSTGKTPMEGFDELKKRPLVLRESTYDSQSVISSAITSSYGGSKRRRWQGTGPSAVTAFNTFISQSILAMCSAARSLEASAVGAVISQSKGVSRGRSKSVRYSRGLKGVQARGDGSG